MINPEVIRKGFETIVGRTLQLNVLGGPEWAYSLRLGLLKLLQQFILRLVWDITIGDGATGHC